MSQVTAQITLADLQALDAYCEKFGKTRQEVLVAGLGAALEQGKRLLKPAPEPVASGAADKAKPKGKE